MFVVIPLLLLYAFMVWTGTLLPYNSRQDVLLVLSAWQCVSEQVNYFFVRAKGSLTLQRGVTSTARIAKTSPAVE